MGVRKRYIFTCKLQVCFKDIQKEGKNFHELNGGEEKLNSSLHRSCKMFIHPHIHFFIFFISFLSTLDIIYIYKHSFIHTCEFLKAIQFRFCKTAKRETRTWNEGTKWNENVRKIGEIINVHKRRSKEK